MSHLSPANAAPCSDPYHRAPPVHLARWVAVEAEQEVSRLVDWAHTEVIAASARRDAAIAVLTEAQDALRIAENRRTELSNLAGHLGNATGPRA